MFLDDNSPNSFSLTFESNTKTFRNPINRKDQFAILPGGRWKANFVFNNLNQDKSDAYVGWIMSLNGQAGTFNCPIISQSITTTTTVKSRSNDSLVVDNSGNLKVGKYFSLNNELKIITDIYPKGADIEILFKPNFRTLPNVGQVLMTNKPTFRARLTTDEIRIISSTAKQRGGKNELFQSFTVDVIEDL